ncbi:MAG: ABC transporter ATP-binding protein [Acutalibacteraceae bacterium]
MELLRTDKLGFTYPNQKEKAVDGVSFALEKGSFSLLIGESGCGKTTLLRLLKNELSPHGEKEGDIFFLDKPLSETAASDIGFVSQEPDEQIVTDKVWHELAFGLENIGIDREQIRLRVAETASYFGIHNLYHRNTDELSGGQKQLLNLASVMVMQPKLLLLDEPTSQLDPITAADFISTLKKLNIELGLTVLLVEHRLEELFPIADEVLVMEKGRLILSGTPKAACGEMKGRRLFAGFPSAARIWNGLDVPCDCPLTVREGRDFLDKYFPAAVGRISDKPDCADTETVLEASGLWFRYEKNSPDILRDFSISVRKGEIFSVLGGNGCGKTTMLNVLSGLDRPYKGKCRVFGKKISEYKGNSLYRRTLAMLSQNPKSVFIKDTVREDFSDILSALEVPEDEHDSRINALAGRFGITGLLEKHPLDLSGGETQKCAVVKLLLTQPGIILLDEPTKGLDAYSKKKFGLFLRELTDSGKTVITVTHDIEFAAEFSDRCALFFDGKLLSVGAPNKFFSGNNYYTTAACRIARGHFENAVLCDEVTALCKGTD